MMIRFYFFFTFSFSFLSSSDLFVCFSVLFLQFGRTPLHIASEIGQKDNVSRLLAKKKPGLEVRDSVSHLFVFFCYFFFLSIVFLSSWEEFPCILGVRRVLRMLYLFCWRKKRLTWKPGIL